MLTLITLNAAQESEPSRFGTAMQAQRFADSQKITTKNLLDEGRNNLLTMAAFLAQLQPTRPDEAVQPAQIFHTFFVSDHYDSLPEQEKYFAIFYLDQAIVPEQYRLKQLLPLFPDNIADITNLCALLTMISDGMKYYDPNYPLEKKSSLHPFIPPKIIHLQALINECITNPEPASGTFSIERRGGKIFFNATIWKDYFISLFPPAPPASPLPQVQRLTPFMRAYMTKATDHSAAIDALKKEGQNNLATLKSFIKLLPENGTIDFKRKILYQDAQGNLYVLNRDTKLLNMYGLTPLNLEIKECKKNELAETFPQLNMAEAEA